MTNAETRSPRRMGKKLLLAALAFILADQAVNHLVIGTGPEGGWLLGRRIAPFDPPIFMPAQLGTLQRLADSSTAAGPRFGDVDFDAELGWAPPTPGTSPDVTWCGGRAGGPDVPRERSDGVRRIATYGCSFTFGSEVAGADAWPALLDAANDDLETINLAVPGYGIDQALLRYERIAAGDDGHPKVDEVWLGLLPGTLLRLVSVYRPALRHYTSTVAVKPRFRLVDGDALELVPCPAQSVEDLVDRIRNSARFAEIVATDGFMQDHAAAYAARGSHPMHWLATTRALLTVLERSGRDWASRTADPADECHRLALALTARFRDRVEGDRGRFRAVILPDRESLVEGPKPWDRLVASFRDLGITVVDCSVEWIEGGAERGDPMWAPNGHYSRQGNAHVARMLATVPLD